MLLSPQLSLDGPSRILGCTPELTSDADFARLLATWPALSEPIRRAIRALLESSQNLTGAVR
jgi:hypothetical protein